MAVSGDTIVVGAPFEDSNATGVNNGNQADNSAGASGAAYVFAFPPATFGNVSTRGFVGTGSNRLIGGVIIQGNTSTRVLFRALGPSLTPFGVSGALLDPQLDLFDGSRTLLAHNDDWMEEPDGTPNAARTAAIGATGLAPGNASEPAILATVAPGNYTAVVSGVGATTGVALVEAYNLGTAP